MENEREDALSEAERRALDELPATLDPPEHLESRIVAELTTRGSIGSSAPPAIAAASTSRRRTLVAAAAVLIAFAAGWTARAWTTPVTSPTIATPRYMLLLYGAPANPEDEPRRVSEYVAWARSIASSGVAVTGEKLDDRAIELGSGTGGHLDPQGLGGYFIVGARDDAAAEELARSHPHLGHGGRIVVRPLVDR
jgi:hypothetical protein